MLRRKRSLPSLGCKNRQSKIMNKLSCLSYFFDPDYVDKLVTKLLIFRGLEDITALKVYLLTVDLQLSFRKGYPQPLA
jgi:hypothetical protein